MSFCVKVGRFEIIATSGTKNGSVPVCKSEAEEYDVFERKTAGSVQRAQQGLNFGSVSKIYGRVLAQEVCQVRDIARVPSF